MQTQQNMGMFRKIVLFAAIAVCLCAAVLIAESYEREAFSPARPPAVAAGAFPHRPPVRVLPNLPRLRPALRRGRQVFVSTSR